MGATPGQIVDSTLPIATRVVPVVLFVDGSSWILTDRGQIFRATIRGVAGR